jgi:hypothetical protein
MTEEVQKINAFGQALRHICWQKKTYPFFQKHKTVKLETRLLEYGGNKKAI